MSKLPVESLAQAATIARGLAMDAVHASQSGHLGLAARLRRDRRGALRARAQPLPRAPRVAQSRPVRPLGGPRVDVPLRVAAPQRLSRHDARRDQALPAAPLEDARSPRADARARAASRRRPGRSARASPTPSGWPSARRWPRRASTRTSTPSSTTTSSASPATAACRRAWPWRRSSFAGHQQLDNLILIYDSNAVTLDAMAKETQSEDTAKRFEAIGFDVQTVDGHEMEAFARGLRAREEGRERQAAAHHRQDAHRQGHPRGRRAPRRRTARAARSSSTPPARRSGFPPEPFYVAPEVRDVLRRRTRRTSTRRTPPGCKTFEAWKAEEPEARRTSSPSRAPTRTRSPSDTTRRTPDATALFAVDPGVPGGHEDRDAQGRAGRPPAARGEDAAPHRRERGPLRLDAQLHRRSQGRRRRLQAGPPHRAQHPLRHPRARHVLHPQRHRRARHLPPERRDVPRLRRLLPRRRSASRRSATCRSSTSSRTTASAWARTGRRTSRSRPSRAFASSRTSTSSAPRIPRRRRARSSPRSSVPTGRRSSP